MAKCFECGAELHEGFTRYVRKRNPVIVVDAVPAMICERCGETEFTLDTVKRLEQIFDAVAEGQYTPPMIPVAHVQFAAGPGCSEVPAERRDTTQTSTAKSSVGKLLRCPGCGETFVLEWWRKHDGPCADGQYYCTWCMCDNRCGCGSRAKKPEGRSP